MKKTFIFINLILIYFIIDFSIAGLYNFFTCPLQTNDFTKAPAEIAQNREKQNFHDIGYYKIISKRDLFKTEKVITPPKILVPKKEDIKKLKVTDLKLKLLGTITGTGTEPYAVIQKKGKPGQLLYMEGDNIDKAIIKTILREKVILIVDGKSQVLLMEKMSSKGKKQKYFTGQNSTGRLKNSSFSSNGFIKNISIKWTDINKLKGEIGSLRRQVRVRPHFHKNHMDGFRIYGAKNTPVFKTLGLNNGDIISSVNGKKIRSVKDAMSLYGELNKLNGNTVMNLGIKRKGNSGIIKYSIK